MNEGRKEEKRKNDTNWKDVEKERKTERKTEKNERAR